MNHSCTLISLVDPGRWHRLQEHFASVLGVPIRTISGSRELLVAPSWPPGFDADRAIALLRIGDELIQLVPPVDPPRTASSVTTPLGTTYAVVPVWATEEQLCAYVVVGPMVVGPREGELEFCQRMSGLGLDAGALWPFLLSLKLHTFATIRAALTLLEEVGTSIAQLAYQAKQIGGLLPMIAPADQAVTSDHTDQILHLLLEAATLATKAEGGSVMVYDSGTDTLGVRASTGLPYELLQAASIRRGEGLAGVAMARRSVLLLDDQTADPELVGRMQRPELVSSLVAPLIPPWSQEPIGVLNLRTSNPQRRFTSEHVELLQRLLDLTCLALSHVGATFQHARQPVTPS